MRNRATVALLCIFCAACAACLAPSAHARRCAVSIEVKNRFKREHRKTYYFDAKDEADCARIAAEHVAAPKPAYILKRTVGHEFR